jgi:hypothetical protein
MGNEPLERMGEPIDRVRARLEALVKANAAPRCGARSKRTAGRPCQAAGEPETDEVLARAMNLLIARGYVQCPRRVSSSNVLQLEIEPLLSPVLNQCTL